MCCGLCSVNTNQGSTANCSTTSHCINDYRLLWTVVCQLLTNKIPPKSKPVFQSSPRVFRRKLLPTTDKELSAIAALANMGSIKIPKVGYSRPAATGIPIRL